MKRSEMVNLISWYINEKYDNGPLACLNDKNFSDYLLTKIEEQGMLPPYNRNAHLKDLSSMKEDLEYCKWEDENA